MDQKKYSLSEARSVFQRRVDERRLKFGMMAQGMLERLERAAADLDKEHEATRTAVRTKIETVNECGQIKIEVFDGLNGAAVDPENSLVTSNAKAHKVRIEAIRCAQAELKRPIVALKSLFHDKGSFPPHEIDRLVLEGAVPADIGAFLDKLRQSIPPQSDDWEVLGVPS